LDIRNKKKGRVKALKKKRRVKVLGTRIRNWERYRYR
jgi:hypothetical protein